MNRVSLITFLLEYGAIMLKWFTKENLRMAIGLTFAGLMVLCLFLGRIDLSIFAVLFLILMEVEKLNGYK
jgi:hypothetical protein